MGNVLAAVSGTLSNTEATVFNQNDYAPFGALMPGNQKVVLPYSIRQIARHLSSVFCGHPNWDFGEVAADYQEEFLASNRDSNNYWPESPTENRSHRHEKKP